jgi:hypothetical protein
MVGGVEGIEAVDSESVGIEVAGAVKMDDAESAVARSGIVVAVAVSFAVAFAFAVAAGESAVSSTGIVVAAGTPANDVTGGIVPEAAALDAFI